MGGRPGVGSALWGRRGGGDARAEQEGRAEELVEIRGRPQRPRRGVHTVTQAGGHTYVAIKWRSRQLGLVVIVGIFLDFRNRG